MPVFPTLGTFLSFGFINVQGCFEIISQTVRAAIGAYPTGHLGWLPGWEEICYPCDVPAARQPAKLWAQLLLLGHSTIAFVSVVRGWSFLVPLMVSFGPFYNGWLFWLCNSTQHVGLPHGRFGEHTVNDFRRSTRTFYLHPIVRFWYFHMNYHIEHHMYAAVPCYHLSQLHAAIKHDLPPTPDGIVQTWKEIIASVSKQKQDPSHQPQVELPPLPAETGKKSN